MALVRIHVLLVALPAVGTKPATPAGFAPPGNKGAENHVVRILEDIPERVTFLFPATIVATPPKKPSGITGGLQ
jgi:hypothetical protein